MVLPIITDSTISKYQYFLELAFPKDNTLQQLLFKEVYGQTRNGRVVQGFLIGKEEPNKYLVLWKDSNTNAVFCYSCDFVHTDLDELLKLYCADIKTQINNQ
ncbi:MAG: hypothetical protein IKO46_06000 [Salinivirgaceae bacterium]|nr:hypothetical protein [Salinivirgaceae bacterium]